MLLPIFVQYIDAVPKVKNDVLRSKLILYKSQL